MPHVSSRSATAPGRCTRIALVAGLLSVPALGRFTAAGSLKVINYPSGGQIVYGPLINVSSLPQAMGFMLRTLHTNFGDRPKVGRFFEARGGNSVATFFTLTAKNGTKPITGLVIVSMPEGAASSAAIVYDGTKSFARTANPMIEKLNEVWQPAGIGTERAAAVPPLRRTPFPDNSGSVSLPAGWRIVAGAEAAYTPKDRTAASQSTIDQIHRIGDASRQHAEDSHAAFDRRNAGLKANEDVRTRANQNFSNNQLDYSVVTDTQTCEHATTYNSYADALVKADPNRYQYVPTQSFLKGVDY